MLRAGALLCIKSPFSLLTKSRLLTVTCFCIWRDSSSSGEFGVISTLSSSSISSLSVYWGMYTWLGLAPSKTCLDLFSPFASGLVACTLEACCMGPLFELANIILFVVILFALLARELIVSSLGGENWDKCYCLLSSRIGFKYCSSASILSLCVCLCCLSIYYLSQ